MPGRLLHHLLLLALALSLSLVASASAALPTIIRTVRSPDDDPTAAASSFSVTADDADALFCDSWRLSVETGNAALRGLRAGLHMEGARYASDSAVAAAEALAFDSDALAAAGWGGGSASAASPAWARRPILPKRVVALAVARPCFP